MSCGHIFNVIGFSSKKPVLSVHIAHVTIRGIIAFHDLTPLCKVLVAARALFFWFVSFKRSHVLLIAPPRKGEPLTPFYGSRGASPLLTPVSSLPLVGKYHSSISTARLGFSNFSDYSFLYNVSCFCLVTRSDRFRLFYVRFVPWLLSTVNPLFASTSDCSFCLFFVFIHSLHPFPISLPCQFRRSRQTL